MAKKQTITLAEPWTFRTIARTIDFPAGEHSVDQEIADAAPKIELKAKNNGNTGSTPKVDAAGTDSAGES